MSSRRILAQIRDLRTDMHGQSERSTELIERSTASIERSTELMREIRAQNERGEQLMAEIRKELALNRKEREETREIYRAEVQITREVIRRNELAFQQGGAALAELAEEVRAQTQAIFQLIDRLGGGTATA